VSLSRWRGQVVLLNFWGSSCVHCLEELPELERINKEVGDGFAVVSVCFDETDAREVQRLVRPRLREMPVYVNPDGLARARYDVQVMPSVYLIDPAGRVLGHGTGARSWPAGELRDLVRAVKE
jgi:thiol-disulfide isomerase/thioredoxin